MIPEKGQTVITDDNIEGLVTFVQDDLVNIQVSENERLVRTINQIRAKVTYYETPLSGVSVFSGEMVEIIGEQVYLAEDGRLLDQYIYNIVGYEAQNGKPFVALKVNISIY